MIFSDPADVAGEGQNQETDVYPETMFLPDTGIQRGSLLLFDGDPETPNMPSLPEGIYRLSKEEIDQENILPKIPCQPLGYRDAKEFMKVCTRITTHCLYRFFDGKKTTRSQFSVPGLREIQKNLKQEFFFNSCESFFR